MSTDLMASPAVDTFDTAILTRAISPARNTLSPEAAQEILRWEFSPQDQERMAELSEKARQGALTPDEEVEIDSYVRVGHIVNLMQAKARLAMQERTHN